jgi:hypothetical protein
MAVLAALTAETRAVVLKQLEIGTFVAPASGPADPLERIQKLAELHSSGALADDEFAAQKAKLLQA